MNPLLTDTEVAGHLGWSKQHLQNERYLDRGDNRDRVPAWIETGTSARPRVLGTRPEEVQAWLDRHQKGGVAA